MLVSRKQEWDVYQEELAPAIPTIKPSVDTALRAKCLTVVVLLAIIAMFITIRSEAIIRTGYDLVQIKAQLIKAEKENELLRLDIAKLKSPQRIQSIAVTELGMVVPPTIYCAANSEKTTPSNPVENTGDQSLWGSLTNALKAGKAEASKGY